MIISKTPFRISFFGGGTDYPIWYEEHGGSVLSASINKYCYITCRYLPPFFDYKYRIVYSRREETKSINEIKHPSVRECLNYMDLNKGVEVHHDADLPARIGLGSSSSFTVGLLNALNALNGKMVTKRQLTLDAIHVEQNLIKENVGSQDQTVSSFGGFNKITFARNNNIIVQPMTLSKERMDQLQSHLMLFFTGFSRTASEIAKVQIKQIPKKEKELKAMYSLVDEAVSILNNNCQIDEFGKLLDKTWKLKRSLTSIISNSNIDDIYETAIKTGALGGKLLGAGGGGFILLFVKPKLQNKVKQALKKLLYVPFRFEYLGSQIIYYGPDYHNHYS